jgi:hypothetical protein
MNKERWERIFLMDWEKNAKIPSFFRTDTDVFRRFTITHPDTWTTNEWR